MTAKNILLVNYDYPPAGGIGTQRIYHFAKYLKRAGYSPIILTNAHGLGKGIDESLIGNPEFESIPIIRLGGEELIPHHQGNLRGLKKYLYRAKLGLKYLYTGQIYHSWYIDCRDNLPDIVRKYQVECVWTTSPTYTSLFIGDTIKRETGVPWIIDLRDSIVGRTESKKNLTNTISNLASAYWEKSLCPRADHIVCATPGILESLTKRCGKSLAETPVSLIYNGFDPDDYPMSNDRITKAARYLQIAYTGTFLGRRNPENFISALGMLADRDPEIAAQIRIVFAGDYSKEINHRLVSLKQHYQVELTGFIPRSKITQLQLDSDVLLLLTVDEIDKNQSEVLTGKVFEYIGANKPILATCPDGPLKSLIDEHGLGLTSPPGNTELLYRNIQELGLEWLKEKSLKFTPSTEVRLKFNRNAQVKQLIRIIENV